MCHFSSAANPADNITKYILDEYQPFLDVLNHEYNWYVSRSFEGEKIEIVLDNLNPGIYKYVNEEEYRGHKIVDVPDAVIVIISPARPADLEEALRLRLEHFENVKSADDIVFERVVILKDIDMSWKVRRPGDPAEVPLNLGPEERRAKEQEWQEGAEKGYELGRKIRAKVSIACSRTGEGVKEPVNDLVMKVLEKRKADDAREREEERQRREEKLLKAMSRWKRLIWKVRSRKLTQKVLGEVSIEQYTGDLASKEANTSG